MSFVPRVHEVYKHFKGDLYQITAIAEHTETGEQLVVYQAMYGEFKIYARPLAMFISRVDREKYPEVAQEFRFELQGPDAGRQKAECGMESSPEPAEKSGAKSESASEPAEESEAKSESSPEPAEESEAKSESAPEPAEESEAKSESASEPAAKSESSPEPAEKSGVKSELANEETAGLDPMLLAFLDSDSYMEKLNILAALQHRITDEMITTMAIACDVEIEDGDVEQRYESLKGCLVTLEKYECNRLR